MYKYRNILYENYSSTHVSKSNTDLVFDRLKEQAWNFEQEIIPHLSANQAISILDFGCGNGSLIYALKNKGYKDIIGIDISKEQVSIANQFGINEVIESSIDDFLISNQKQFDMILGMDIIEHFSKDELLTLILKLKTLMSKNGILIFRTPNMDAAFASVYAHGDFTHEVFLNKNSAKQLFLSLGFTKVEVFPSKICIKNPLKKALQSFLWFFVKMKYKSELFSSGRTWKDVIFTPNMIIKISL